jgi:hypothetical protein
MDSSELDTGRAAGGKKNNHGQGRPITFNLRTLFDFFSKPKSYEKVKVNTQDSGASSPGASGSDSEWRSHSHSHSQSQSHPAASVLAGIAQAASSTVMPASYLISL